MVEQLGALERELRERYRQAGQEHVFHFWQDLSPRQREPFLRQLADVDLALIDRLARELAEGETAGAVHRLEPAEFVPAPRTAADREAAKRARADGEELLRAGKVAAFVVAGGQGSRLGFDGPKGTFSIGPVSGKSLFQIHAEKVRATAARHGVRIPLLILTSPANHEATESYFADHAHYGLAAADVLFLKQEMMPAVDRSGKLLLAERDSLFLSPNGHGGSLLALKKSGALDEMQRRGIEELFYFQVDNPLVKVLDPVFLGYHSRLRAEMSSKVVMKRDPHEKVGVVAVINGKLGVIEYSDLSDAQKTARAADGSLVFSAGSIAIHALNVDFVERLTTGGDLRLPFHRALKRIAYRDRDGALEQPTEPNGVKFETFIFDALQFAARSLTMEVLREEEFAPVKNAEGVDSPATAKDALSRRQASWLRAAGFTVPDDAVIEISPLFALDQEELLTKLAGKGTIVDRRLLIE